MEDGGSVLVAVGLLSVGEMGIRGEAKIWWKVLDVAPTGDDASV